MNLIIKTTITSAFIFIAFLSQIFAQNMMTPDLLLQLGRVSGMGISIDGDYVIYSVRHYDVNANNGSSKMYKVSIKGGDPIEISSTEGLLANDRLSPNGMYKITAKDVKMDKVYGSDYYPNMDQSNMMIYDDLNYRHWDQYEDGAFSHVFLHKKQADSFDLGMDIMADEPFDCPQQPFGGNEDFIWSSDSKNIIYTTKKASGTEYTKSTNTDIFKYNIESGITTNLTKGMMGYDNSPSFSSKGKMAWLSMKTQGFESDKNDIIVYNGIAKMNLTAQWDGTVAGYVWSNDGNDIYFTAAINGTKQLFKVNYPDLTKRLPVVTQITEGEFDLRSIVGQKGEEIVLSRTDMNHAVELYVVSIKDGSMRQLTHVNDAKYNSISLSKIERRYTTTTNNKKMLSWVIYPPNFDPNKKYPTLLYLQGGPQGALSQFYSFRWNFQLMAANGYIIIAPNRHGMPGFGVEWNAQISKDYGGQCMDDYLSAIDDFSKEAYVDNDRIGAIGASFGGYSAFYLMGKHEKRFKTFISHDGIFNWYSMYGTTEEMWFINWDLGGPYWEKDNVLAQKGYTDFNPLSFVDKWDTPILIIQGGKDYRVPVGQGLEAFQAAKLKGLKSRLLYFPEENHWVLQAQNSYIWHNEFYRWLKETL